MNTAGTDTARQLSDTVVQLAGRPDQACMQLARALRALRDRDPIEFAHAVKAAGLGKRKLAYLLAIDKAFGPMRRSTNRLNAIGWTRLGAIAPKVGDEPERWLSAAESKNVRQLEAMIRGEAKGGRRHVVQMYLTSRQYAEFRDAILAHGGKERGRPGRSRLAGKEAALMKMVRAARPSGK
ncbi:MAG: hypothetical protein QM651_01415 [Rhodoblastus sp.]